MKRLKISLIGLGYVGMPIAIAFANKNIPVIGFDINKEKIAQYISGLDPTHEVGEKAIKETSMVFTYNKEELRNANFHIIAVPTPLKENNTPDLRPLQASSKTVGSVLKKGDYVVYESTVYPGVTEDICIPILEEKSGLVCGIDFKVGYSPERINPGDKINTLETIIKVVAGYDKESLEYISRVYELVVDAGVHKASSIKVAEASKIIENAQRDVNIAFMNELSKIFNLLDINTNEVLEAAKTKWNFLNFTPGLVGGHCIGVDPYYLTNKAQQLGYYPEIMLSGRKINDGMGQYVAENTIKKMVKANVDMNRPKIAILGLTFKENTPDIRNTRVVDIIEGLQEFNFEVIINDPLADRVEAKKEYGLDLIDLKDINNVDVLIAAVSHKDYLSLDLKEIQSLYKDNRNILIDVKGTFKKYKNHFNYWSL